MAEGAEDVHVIADIFKKLTTADERGALYVPLHNLPSSKLTVTAGSNKFWELYPESASERSRIVPGAWTFDVISLATCQSKFFA